MKKLVFTAVLAAASVGLSQANTIVDHAETSQEATLQNEKEIKFSEVPEAVQNAFMQDGYKEEDVLKVWEIDSGEGLTEYKFLLEVDGQKSEISYKAQTK